MKHTAPAIDCSMGDFSSYYSGTFVVLPNHKAVARVEGTTDDEVVLEVFDGNKAEIKHCDIEDLYVHFPEVFYTKSLHLAGNETARSYKRAPYRMNCSLREFWEYMYEAPPNDDKRIGWQYCVTKVRLQRGVTSVVLYLGVAVGIADIKNKKLYVRGVHAERINELLVGECYYELAETIKP